MPAPLPDLSPASGPSPGDRAGRRLRRRPAIALGIAGAALVGSAAPPADAETYYTGSCSYAQHGTDGVTRYRNFQARINGSIEQGTGRYLWSSYDYRYTVDPGLTFGPHSDERVTVTQGYVSGLTNPWQSPDSHGTSGGWIAEPNWKGIRSSWGWTRVSFYAAFDVPSTPDPHCTTTTARV